MARGTVSKFDVSAGYGYIRPDNTTTEIFVHGSSLAADVDTPLSLGKVVYFEILSGPHGRQAVEVRPARGNPATAGPAGGPETEIKK